MTLAEWRSKTSDKKVDILAQAVLNKTRYAPHWDKPDVQWDVIASRRVYDRVVLLCKREGEYAVFTDLLMPKSIPSDKFYGNINNAVSAYVSIILRQLGWSE